MAIVILSIAVVAVGGLSVAALSVIGILLFFFLIALLFSFLGYLILEVSSRSKRKKAYKNRYGAACKELDEAKRRVNDYADQNAVIIRTAYAVLPDYYYDEYALAHMITSLKNHRATSLSEALNLFITDKNAKEQHQLVQKQLRAAELAAENAGRAADAAASAASAADRAATNTYYNNLRNP
ncbi:MAG: hypothetical protein LUC48_07075 [Clostridiales bacterium]|nr:hypothetical protein [Clostridiales bacterium]